MKARLELITPKRAAEYLARNTQNRPLMARRVETMANDMRHGRWRLTHQGIAFNCDGSLRDGQHRLAAIVASGMPVRAWVFEGLTDEAMEVIDTHRSRSVADVAHFQGLPVGRNEVATATRMIQEFHGDGRTITSRQEILDACRTHLAAIQFAHEGLGSRSYARHASIAAVVAKAYYHVDRDRLRQFCEVLSTGVVSDPADSAAATLLRFLMANPAIRAGGTGTRAALSRRATAALVAFLDHRPLSRLYEATVDPWPLPE